MVSTRNQENEAEGTPAGEVNEGSNGLPTSEPAEVLWTAEQVNQAVFASVNSPADDLTASRSAGESELMLKAKSCWAYQKCTILGASASSTEVRCDICGFERKMTPHKMGYGHYLRQAGNDVKQFCVGLDILQRDHTDFYAELIKRKTELDNKRKRALEAAQKSSKRQRQAEEGVDTGVPPEDGRDSSEPNTTTSTSSKRKADSPGIGSSSNTSATTPMSEMRWAMLKPEDKKQRSDVANASLLY